MRQLAILILGVLVSFVGVYGAHAMPLEDCQTLPVAYENLRSHWRWIDNETVVFSFWDGPLPRGIFFLTERTAWYVYNVSTQELKESAVTPYDEVIEATVPAGSLVFLPRNKRGSYEDVFVSPSGQQFVYSEYDPRTATRQVWYDDRQAGRRFKLDLEMPTYDIWLIEWAADGRRFVVHPIYGLPMYVVTIDDAGVIVQDVTHIPALDWLGNWTANGLSIKGISPDGRYLLGQSELDNDLTWVLIWDEARYETLNFSLWTTDGIAWLNETTFVANTSIGLVEYDLAVHKLSTRPVPDLVNDFGGRLSPDGRYMIGMYQIDQGRREVFVCRVG